MVPPRPCWIRFEHWVVAPVDCDGEGASGTLIDHAEHKVSIEHVAMLLEQFPEGFEVCACAADIEEVG